MIRLAKDLLLPLIVVAINVILGARTGLVLFYVMAAVILALYAVKLWRTLRNPPGKQI